jgi:hypothetical protein
MSENRAMRGIYYKNKSKGNIINLEKKFMMASFKICIP